MACSKEKQREWHLYALHDSGILLNTISEDAGFEGVGGGDDDCLEHFDCGVLPLAWHRLREIVEQALRLLCNANAP